MALIQPQELIEGDIFELLGLQNISDSQKEALMAKIIEGLQSRVAIRIDEMIPESDRPRFHEILDKGTDDELRAFLQEKNIDIAKIIAEEAILQKAQILQLKREK